MFSCPPSTSRLLLTHYGKGRSSSPTPALIGSDLLPPICSGRLRAPRGILVLTGPGHSTETPTLVPSNSCSSASDSDRTASSGLLRDRRSYSSQSARTGSPPYPAAPRRRVRGST